MSNRLTDQPVFISLVLYICRSFSQNVTLIFIFENSEAATFANDAAVTAAAACVHTTSAAVAVLL